MNVKVRGQNFLTLVTHSLDLELRAKLDLGIHYKYLRPGSSLVADFKRFLASSFKTLEI